MTRLPRISGADCVKALERAGFRQVRQRGSHVVMTRSDPFAAASIPQHRLLKPGTLRGILRNVHMTVEDFAQLL